jgi:hypothetical protein
MGKEIWREASEFSRKPIDESVILKKRPEGPA